MTVEVPCAWWYLWGGPPGPVGLRRMAARPAWHSWLACHKPSSVPSPGTCPLEAWTHREEHPSLAETPLDVVGMGGPALVGVGRDYVVHNAGYGRRLEGFDPLCVS